MLLGINFCLFGGLNKVLTLGEADWSGLNCDAEVPAAAQICHTHTLTNKKKVHQTERGLSMLCRTSLPGWGGEIRTFGLIMN